MRKITPIILAAFALFAIIGIYLYQESKSSHLTQVHSGQLAAYANQVSIPLQEAISSAQEMARGAATRVFANELRRVGADNVTTALNGQSEMQTNMQTLLGNSERSYFAVRYVGLDGTVWTEVTNRSGILTPNSRQQPQVLASDNFFLKAMTASQPLLSGVTMRQISPGVVEPAIRIFVPVTANDAQTETLGLISLEILVRPIVTPVNLADEGTGQRWVLVNRDGRYMADSTSPRAYLSSLSTTSNVTLTTTEPELAELLQTQGNQIYLAGTSQGMVSSRQITVGNAEDMPWTLLVIDSSGYTVLNIIAGVAVIVLISAASAGVTLVAVRRILRHRLEPLSAISGMVEQMAAGTFASAEAIMLPVDIKSGQEIEAAKRVATRLQDLTEENEDLVTRHSRNLEIANRVSQETAAITDLDTLVNRTIDLICSEYGFYHAQVFLMDDVGLNAILVYSRGLIGQRLLEQQLLVSANDLSVVGGTIRTGHATIANSLHDASSPFDRMLPDTRAQMALPLFVNERMIGVLDIHSIVANVLHEEEAHVFQLLANQLAGAIANARLLVEAHQRNDQIDTLNKHLTRAAWDDVQEQAGLENAYRYNLIAVEPATPEAISSASSDITASLSIRGEVIGTIAASSAQNQPFTQGDYMVLQAIAERVSLVIEGARLFKETQNVLSTTSLLYQLSRFLNEANTLEDIVKAIVEATMSDASGGQIWLFDEYAMGSVPQWVEIITDWSGLDRAGQSRTHLRLSVAESQFLITMQDNNVRLVQDMALDQRLDSNLRQMFLAWGTRA
ncbi:MAG TPA: GAF domain-containing protein, partial [Phototrophicaceae bacterium]|nr:GAF domain-containing protein [Phototrophicaceae bacterium]